MHITSSLRFAAAGMRLVGAEVAEVGNIGQFVFRHGRPLDLPVEQDDAVFG